MSAIDNSDKSQVFSDGSCYAPASEPYANVPIKVDAHIIAAIVEDIESGGPISQAIARVYNLKRKGG